MRNFEGSNIAVGRVDISLYPLFIIGGTLKKTIELVINNDILLAYEKYYFKQHPKAKKKPIPHPYHPSINEWMIMKRPMMNCIKGKWKDFIIWFIEQQGYTNLHIKKCEMAFTTYYKTNVRHDVDNTTPKFILDGFSESGLLIDDDYKHLSLITLECGIDKNYPRTEIIIKILED